MTDRSRSENAEDRKTTHNLRTGVPTMKETKPIIETPPLTRAGRQLAEVTLAAAKFKPMVEGKRMVRDYVVHGIKVTEWVGEGGGSWERQDIESSGQTPLRGSARSRQDWFGEGAELAKLESCNNLSHGNARSPGG
jgi:hypothetical protein